MNKVGIVVEMSFFPFFFFFFFNVKTGNDVRL